MSKHGVVHGSQMQAAPSWGSFPAGWDGAPMVSAASQGMQGARTLPAAPSWGSFPAGWDGPSMVSAPSQAIQGARTMPAGPSWGAFPAGWDGMTLQSSLPGGASPASGGCGGLPSSGVYGSSLTTPLSSMPESTEDWAEDPEEAAKSAKKKAERRDKRGKRKRDDAKTANEVLFALGIFNALLWTICVFGGQWHSTMFAGFGVGFTQLSANLFSMSFAVECPQIAWPFGLEDSKFKAMSPEHQVCKILQSMSGTHSLRTAKGMACAITASFPSSEACQIMGEMYHFSYFLIFGLGISALLSFFASVFLYYYWYEEHMKQIRNVAMGLYCASPVTGILTFAIYTAIIPDVGDLPKSWTSMIAMFNAGTGIGEIKSIGDGIWNKHGWTWFFCFVTFAFALAPPVVWGVFFKKHPDERAHERTAKKEIEQIELAVVELEEKRDYVETGNMDMYAQRPGSAHAHLAYGSQPSDAYGSSMTGAHLAYGSQPTDAYGSSMTGTVSQSAYGAAMTGVPSRNGCVYDAHSAEVVAAWSQGCGYPGYENGESYGAYPVAGSPSVASSSGYAYPGSGWHAAI